MSTIFFILTATSFVDFIFLLITGAIVVGIVFAVLDVIIVLVIGYSLAIIGDAVGTRRVCGIAFVSAIP